MSPKQLGWTGLACLVLSALAAGLGYVVQIGLILAYLALQGLVLGNAPAVGGAVGPMTVPVPRVLPAVLVVAALLLAAALTCLVEATRRGRSRRPSA